MPNFLFVYLNILIHRHILTARMLNCSTEIVKQFWNRIISKMVPNRFLFRDTFDRPGSSEAFCFQNKQSPSLEEGGEGDCGRANKMDAYEQKAVSLRRQLFIPPFLVPARPG